MVEKIWSLLLLFKEQKELVIDQWKCQLFKKPEIQDVIFESNKNNFQITILDIHPLEKYTLILTKISLKRQKTQISWLV